MTNRIRLTAGRVDAFACPTGKSQAFLWDTEAPALALRATPTGRKTYAFEARLNGDTLRVNIGTVADWPLDKARTEAQRLKMLVDAGTDPRQLKRQQQAEAQAEAVAAHEAELTRTERRIVQLRRLGGDDFIPAVERMGRAAKANGAKRGERAA